MPTRYLIRMVGHLYMLIDRTGVYDPIVTDDIGLVFFLVADANQNGAVAYA